MRPLAATAAARTTRQPARPAKPRDGAPPASRGAANPRAPARRRAARSSAPASRRSAPRRVARTAAPRIHRRVSGPARRRAAPVRGRGRVAPPPVRLARFVRTLPDRRLVYRLVEGQWWIVVIGFLLMGIVAMQVSLLKLNAEIGRDVERSASLQRRNGELRAEVSRLSSGERIQAQASGLGMVMPPAGAVSYLRAGGARDARAAAEAVEQGRFAPGAQPIPLPSSTPAPPSAAQPPAAPGASTDADAVRAGGTLSAAGASP